MSSSIDELEQRLAGLKNLADDLNADRKSSGFPIDVSITLDEHHELVENARHLNVPIPDTLTKGTLMAAVIGEIDSVECALKVKTAVRHQ